MATTLDSIILTTPDMSCAHCVATIEKAVGELPGVASVSADLSRKDVTVSFDPGRVSPEQIAAVLDEAGYPVAK